MNMNCCGNDCGLSQILTKEEDLSNKESIWKDVKNWNKYKEICMIKWRF